MYISAIANAFMKEAEPLQQYLLEKAAKTENWVCTGCFKANLDTLINDYDKYNSVCTEKTMVDLFSAYPEISFDNNKSEKNT